MITFGNAQMLGDRQSQEDYFAIFSAGDCRCAVVADGMGGHVAGAVASELAVKSFREYLLAHEVTLKDYPPTLLMRALEQANQSIADWIEDNPAHAGMGTTLIATCITGDSLFHISVGDSPLYRLQGGILSRVNQNHAFSEALLEAVSEGAMTATEAARHPDRSAITSALCGEAVPEIDVPSDGITLQAGDSYLLASDGIHTLDDDSIAQILSNAPKAQQAADNLIQAVAEAREPHQDNTTAVVLHVIEERITQPLHRKPAGS